MTDSGKGSSGNSSASSPGSEVNDKDSDYGVVRANLLLGLAMSK